MQEVVTEFNQIIVAGEGSIYSLEKSFPWAEDCLRELKEYGVRVVILQSLGSPDLSKLGLNVGVHYDAVIWHESALELLSTLAEAREQNTLVVGDSLNLMQAAHSAGLKSAFICSGKHSSVFGLSAAPKIDVPANGGHFVEPEGMLDGCVSLFGKEASPNFMMSCFSYSDACSVLVKSLGSIFVVKLLHVSSN